MPKRTPLGYGKYYHIYNRGNNRENIFLEERNYHYFLKLYTKYIEPIADTFAYCLLYNHFHFLVRIKTVEEQEASQIPGVSKAPGILEGVLETFAPKKPNQQFGNFFDAYAKAINKAYNRTGSLFQNPFGRIEVTSVDYFIHLITYIHQNSQRHGLVADFRTWPYSSYQALLSNKPTRLKREIVLTWFDGPAGVAAVHQRRIIDQPLAPDDFD